MFTKSSSVTKQSTIRALVYSGMARGNVKDHCLAMISHFSHVKVMGAKLKQQMKIDMVLESLLDSFGYFKMSNNMMEKNLTSTQLMHMLENVEESLGKLHHIYHIESSNKLKEKSKGGNKNKKDVEILVTKRIAMKKSKGKCFKHS